MNPLQTLRVALRAITRNKLRAFLTTLGIVIGVGAVIAMMAIGAGAKARVEEAFAAMGTNVLIILPVVRRRPRWLRLDADVDLGRPRGHSQRRCYREDGRADDALEHARRQRGQ
jgi:ABC-type lipoprotein release transport system permease subunit